MSEDNLEKGLDDPDFVEDLSERMAGDGEVIDVVIPFLNNDVPEYLARLREFSEASRKTELMIGYQAG